MNLIKLCIFMSKTVRHWKMCSCNVFMVAFLSSESLFLFLSLHCDNHHRFMVLCKSQPWQLGYPTVGFQILYSANGCTVSDLCFNSTLQECGDSSTQVIKEQVEKINLFVHVQWVLWKPGESWKPQNTFRKCHVKIGAMIHRNILQLCLSFHVCFFNKKKRSM